jgi:hypothetical protein
MPLSTVGGEVPGPSSLNAFVLGPDGPIILSPPIDVSKAAYAVNEGVCAVPVSPDHLNLLESYSVGLVAAGDTTLLLNEPLEGRYVNVEPFSLRLNPGQSGTVTLYARNFGKPLSGLGLPLGFDYQQISPANSPATAVRIPSTVKTQPSGQASIEISASAPRPLADRRWFIDSQVYFLGGEWESWGQISAMSQAAISVLVFNDSPLIDNPTWIDVQPILNQYAVLYPGMAQRFYLSSFQAVFGSSAEVLETISLPIEDPAHIPVTRDLSASHRALIQTWIRNDCPEGGINA